MANGSPHDLSPTAGGATGEQIQTATTVANKSVSPAAHTILQCDLICPREGGASEIFPLKELFVELSLFEDLYSGVLRGTLDLRDSNGWMERMPIIGEETLAINAMTPGTDIIPISTVGKSNFIQNKFRVTSIANIKNEGDGVKTYTLTFVSKEWISNLSKKVQRSFPNSGEGGMLISDMIYKLFREYLDITTSQFDRQRLFKVEQTKGLQKISISNMTPFAAINFLASRAVSETNPKGSLFFFYETFTDGFRFESAETLMSDGLSRATYVYAPQNLGENVGISLYNVEGYHLTSAFDVLSNMVDGMYNSRLIAHDIVRMKYSILDYNYVPQAAETTSTEYDDFGDPITITETNPDAGSDENYPKHQTRSVINDTFKHLGKDNESGYGNRLTVDDFDAVISPKRKYNPPVVKLYPTNNKHDVLFSGTETGILEGESVSEPNIKTNQVETWMLQRPAQLQQLKNIQIRFTVAGDTTRHVGDVVTFEMPSHLPSGGSPSGAASNQFYGGKYLVTHIRHRFGTNEFKTEMQLAKDSLDIQMDAQTRKPKPGGSSTDQQSGGQGDPMIGWE